MTIALFILPNFPAIFQTKTKKLKKRSRKVNQEICVFHLGSMNISSDQLIWIKNAHTVMKKNIHFIAILVKKYPLNALKLLSDHQQHDTKYVVKRRIPVVPKMVGLRIPDRYKEDNADIYDKYALLLFKPFRNLDFESMKQKSYKFILIIYSEYFKEHAYNKILENLQEYYEGKRLIW